MKNLRIAESITHPRSSARSRLPALLVLCLLATVAPTTLARDFRVNQLPNGSRLGCVACHVSPAGGGARNAFGQAVSAAIGGSPAAVPFWSPALAALDSDNDGFCNGQEVGDPDGDGAPLPGATVTSPGSSASKPANSPPAFSSQPPLELAPGVPYEYQAEVLDPDACQNLSFSKVAGPDWLTVSATGLVSGTPPAGTQGDTTVTVRVVDSGSPAQSADQTFVLAAPVRSPFAGWQTEHFSLPGEASLAGPLEDPDGDRILNLFEYALRLDPRSPDVLPPARPAFNASGQMRLTIDLRDDDPQLVPRLVVADSVGFLPSVTLEGIASDPVPGDGWRTWVFEDVSVRTEVAARFGRIVLEPAP